MFRAPLAVALALLALGASSAASAAHCPTPATAIQRLKLAEALDADSDLRKTTLDALSADLQACGPKDRPVFAALGGWVIETFDGGEASSESQNLGFPLAVALLARTGASDPKIENKLLWRGLSADAFPDDAVDRIRLRAIQTLNFSGKALPSDPEDLHAVVALAGEDEGVCRKFSKLLLDQSSEWSAPGGSGARDQRLKWIETAIECAALRDHPLAASLFQAYARVLGPALSTPPRGDELKSLGTLAIWLGEPGPLVTALQDALVSGGGEDEPAEIGETVLKAVVSLDEIGKGPQAHDLQGAACARASLSGTPGCVLAGLLLQADAGGRPALNKLAEQFPTSAAGRKQPASVLGPDVVMAAAAQGNATLLAAISANVSVAGNRRSPVWPLAGCLALQTSFAHPADFPPNVAIKKFEGSLSRGQRLPSTRQSEFLDCLARVLPAYAAEKGGPGEIKAVLHDAQLVLDGRPADDHVELRLKLYSARLLAIGNPETPETFRGLTELYNDATAPAASASVVQFHDQIIRAALQAEVLFLDRGRSSQDALRAMWMRLNDADRSRLPSDLSDDILRALQGKAQAAAAPRSRSNPVPLGQLLELRLSHDPTIARLRSPNPILRDQAIAAEGQAQHAKAIAADLSTIHEVRQEIERTAAADLFGTTRPCVLGFLGAVESLSSALPAVENDALNALLVQSAIIRPGDARSLPALPLRRLSEALTDLRDASTAALFVADVDTAWKLRRMRLQLIETHLNVARDDCGFYSGSALRDAEIYAPKLERSLLGAPQPSATMPERIALLATALSEGDLPPLLSPGPADPRALQSMQISESAARRLDLAGQLQAQRLMGRASSSTTATVPRVRVEAYQALLRLISTLTPQEAVVYFEDGTDQRGPFVEFGAVSVEQGFVFGQSHQAPGPDAIKFLVNSLDVAGAASAADIKPFDVDLAYKIYAETLGRHPDVLKGKTRLYVIARGSFASLPVGLLVTVAPPSGTAQRDYSKVAWLEKQTQIVYLRMPEDWPANPPPPSRKALVLADPDYGRALPRSGLAEGPSNPTLLTLGASTGAAASPRSLVAPFSTCGLPTVSARPFTQIAGVDMRVGPAASEALIKQLDREARLADYGLLVLYAHGEQRALAGGRRDPTAIALAPSPGCDVADDAGVRMEDGFLTASEIELLGLNADWVVLAGCVTGDSRAALDRAFMRAGARSVVVSGTSVPSEATGELVRRLIAAPGSDPAAALSSALEGIRSDPRWRHPAYWGAWMLTVRPDVWAARGG